MVTQFWRCDRKADCKDRVHDRNGQVMYMVRIHSHPRTPCRIQAMSCATDLKRRAVDTDESAESVLSNWVDEVYYAECESGSGGTR